ncbi:MAG: bile acid:sodium symporter [Pseudomonadota bacterium]|nr:bile acid:sodium symporter [Pseudomonadota bacterium]
MSDLSLISDVAVPAVVWLLMLVVGLDLTVADFRRVLVYPKAVAVATFGQLLLLPLTAALLIWTLDPEPYVVAGMVLLAACPGGAISNFYAYLARANVALSVTLTATSSLVALGTMPALTSAGLALFLDHGEAVDVPITRLVVQLAIMLVTPVAVGMALRRWCPSTVERYAQGLRRLSLVALAALVGVILLDQRRNLAGEIGPVVLAAVLYSLIAMAAGWGVGRLAGFSREDCFTLLLEFAARNLAVTAVIGIIVLGRVEFVLFATLFFLTQLPIVLLMIGAFVVRSKKVGFQTRNPFIGQGQ